ncbi:hypothetical protein LU699_07985 [Luteimonas fraxinea]|uniref:Uncharacterized protein n=1 Tax=Luteimonas fraxinea TaxID=2901869 RepID=A0ABS8UEF7_9GAMM|nr:hypothetical protein [Luteimonas fraxinea]MCD9097372.1 hypothetical protein [Luteimonas fraxinea]MCD9125064.1 hypothetical protein [Luteimonas fraxinea]UHH11631.1 hypothetical protein LU699_07985 [Luteimonas fraxinea]
MSVWLTQARTSAPNLPLATASAPRFDAKRRSAEAIAADADDLRELEAAEKALGKRTRGPRG